MTIFQDLDAESWDKENDADDASLSPPVGSRRLECGLCNRVVFSSALLRAHMRQHTNEKPMGNGFVCCEVCGASAASNDMLAAHIEREHGIECVHCSEHFRGRMELAK